MEITFLLSTEPDLVLARLVSGLLWLVAIGLFLKHKRILFVQKRDAIQVTAKNKSRYDFRAGVTVLAGIVLFLGGWLFLAIFLLFNALLYVSGETSQS